MNKGKFVSSLDDLTYKKEVIKSLSEDLPSGIKAIAGKTNDGMTTNFMKDIARQSRKLRAMFSEPIKQ